MAKHRLLSHDLDKIIKEIENVVEAHSLYDSPQLKKIISLLVPLKIQAIVDEGLKMSYDDFAEEQVEEMEYHIHNEK